MATVTAIIPTYNRAHFIVEAVESVLQQSRPVDEIIVVDDGSKDNTREVLKPYHEIIGYIWQRNSGPGAARNRGMKEARGEYIALLDSDDIWVKDKMKIQMEFLGRHPDVDIAFGKEAIFTRDRHNGRAEIADLQIYDYLKACSENLERMLECLIVRNFVPTSSVVFKRTCIGRVGLFDESLKIAEDLDFWLRATQSCRFGFVNATLVKRRKHEDNLVRNWAEMNDCWIEVLQRLLDKDLSPNLKRQTCKRISALQYDLGSHYFNRGDYAKAGEYLRKGLFTLNMLNWKWMAKFTVSLIINIAKGKQRL